MARLRIPTVLGVQNHPGSDWNRRGLSGRLTAGRQPTLAAYRAAKAIIAISNGVAADMRTRFPDLGDRISTIYNVGCDDQVFAGAQKPLNTERPRGPLIVACGRLEAQKDYPTLLRATARLLPEFPALNLWILGKGKEKAALEQLAAELGLADKIQFLGFQTNPFSYMAAADVFVLSSRWEGFGNVLVEAMACGTAVVSTRAPFGPEEILENGKHGELCAVADPDALATSIAGLLRDPERRQALGASGRKRASDFSPHPIAAAYERVLSEVLNGVRADQ